MPSVLQELENNDAVLLMYVADELPAEDRAEVERMLAVDPALRADLDRLRETQGWFAAELARADRGERLPVSEAAAVRRVGRAMRQWQARRLASAPAPQPAASGLRYPWWAYPLTAAASVVIAFLVWWGNTDTESVAQRGPTRQVVVRPEGQQQRQHQPPQQGFAPDPAIVANHRAEMIARSLGLHYGPDGYGGPTTIEAAESELEETRSVYAAVAPSDANVMMLMNTPNPAERQDAVPEDETTYQ